MATTSDHLIMDVAGAGRSPGNPTRTSARTVIVWWMEVEWRHLPTK